MVERKVSFGIDLSPGVGQLRQQLASVEQLSKQSLLSIQHAQERHNQKMVDLKKRLMQIDNDASSSSIAAHRRATQAIESEEQRHNLRMKQMIERGQLAQMQSRNGGFNLSSLGHIAQSAGFYRTGHLMRSMSDLGIGSQMGGKSAGGAGAAAEGAEAGAVAAEAGAMAGLTAATAGAALAIGGLMVASKLVEVGFKAVAQTAQQVVGAIGQIGGARNLQEMLVEGASTERLSANIAGNVTEKLSTSDVMLRINAMSGKTEFNPQQIGAMFEAYVAKTGTMSPLTNLGMFAPNFATVSKMGPGETGNFLGQLTAQFGLVGDQLKQAALMLWQAGRAGTVELKDTSSVSEALGFARKAGAGNLMQGIATEMGAIQLTHAGLGGSNPAEAVTALKRFQEELENPKKQWTIQSALGGGPIMAQGPGGMPVYRNLKDTIARASLYELEHPGGLKGLGFEERGTRVPRGIGEYTATHTPGFQQATHADKLKMIADTLEKFSDSKVVLDEFDGALKKAEETVDYQFKQAFNQVSVELEGVFLPVLKELAPALKDLANRVTEHKNEIGDAFRSFVTGLLMVVEILPSMAEAVGGLIQWALSFIPNAGEHITNLQGDIVSKRKLQETQKQHPGFFAPGAVEKTEKDIEEDKRQIRVWESIQKVQNINFEQAKKDAAARAAGLFPSGASDTWKEEQSAITQTKVTNTHLENVKTIQQKQLDVLNAIRNNTMPAPPQAPNTSKDGH